jgi:two-component system, cell cycle response regulator DivK
MEYIAALPMPLIGVLAGVLLLGALIGYALHGRAARTRSSQQAGAPRQGADSSRGAPPARAALAEPRLRSATPRAALPLAPARSDRQDAPAVLIADDQPQILALHAEYLQHHGYRVLLAEDGLTALERARTHHPDVIVLDHSMGGLTGIDVARELKRDAATADIPILLLTAHSYGAIGHAARAAGCAAFVSKPVVPSRLLHELAMHLPAAQA